MIYGDKEDKGVEIKIPDIEAIMQSNNLYVYCMNNPVKYIDITGELAYPGQIHNIVVDRVAGKYGYYKEQTINYSIGWGRADLISRDGQVWDVKRDKPSQIAAGVKQVLQYTQNEWRKFKDKNIDLKVGGYIDPDSFVVTLNIDTYYVSYQYAGGGVIAYDYYKVTDWETVKSYATTAGVTVLAALAFLASQGTVQLQPVC